MIKTIAIIFLCNIININFIDAYAAQKCYVCDQGCDHPSAGDIKSCSDSTSGGTSGTDFVKGALGSTGSTAKDIYKSVEDDLSNYGKDELGLNSTVMPQWTSLTQWVCYKTMDKRRGCLIMGKGLCKKDKSWSGILSDFGNKINNIMGNIQGVVTAMFSDNTAQITDDQKKNISSWFVENYFTKLVNKSDKPEFKLDFCCEGSSCNSASIILKSSAAVLILSILIFV